VESTSFDLLLNTLSLDLLAHHAPIGPLKGTIGISGMHEINDSRGPIPLVPDARVNAGALFVLEQASTGPVTLLAGGRVDVRRLNADANTTLAFAANVGRAWRAPTLFELFSNGPQLGEARYDLGDPTLVPELGTSIDASIRWETGRVRGSLAGYTNLVNHFIYITPTAQFRDSLRVYDYVQASARLIGAEASLEVEATRMLAFHATADAVRGTNRDTDVPLPLMPPPRLTVGAEVHAGADPAAARVGASVQMVARQTRLNPMDVPTNGYALLALSAGLTHRLGGRDFHFDLDVHNALNTKYTSFLSRYKEFALNPGRNIIVRISTAD
jgi:outer membrane receptor protein involved in Fe transport